MPLVLFSFALGCCLGSFGAATAYVWLHDKPFLRRRSRCPSCGHVLGVWDLIPLVSFCLLKGHCRHCGAPISPVSSLVELCCCFLAACFVLVEGMNAVSLLHCLLTALLVTASLCDIKAGLLPDFATLGGLVVIVPSLVLAGALRPTDAAAGAIIGAAVSWALRQTFIVLREKEALGMGDVKLLALLGGACGWRALPSLLLFASIIGIVALLLSSCFHNSDGEEDTIWERPLPFGPFLCAAALALLLFPELALLPGRLLI